VIARIVIVGAGSGLLASNLARTLAAQGDVVAEIKACEVIGEGSLPGEAPQPETSTRGHKVGDPVRYDREDGEPSYGRVIDLMNGHAVVQFDGFDVPHVMIGVTMDKLVVIDEPTVPHPQGEAPQPEAARAPGSPLEPLILALRDDHGYAWSWHCNLAMTAMDAARMTHADANVAAAGIMDAIFGIDTGSFAEYGDIMTRIEAAGDDVPGPRGVAGKDSRYDPLEAAHSMARDVEQGIVVAVSLAGITSTGAVRLYGSESSGQTLNMLAQAIKVADGTLLADD